jgi:predicted lipid-binding transport protein (Tim44 family)
MNGQFDLITLIALVIAIAAIVKLRKVLGQRSDEDEQRLERWKAREREAAGRGAPADVITMPRRERDTVPAATVPEPSVTTAEARVRAYPAVDASVTDGLLAIANVDTAFDPDEFLAGARRAYEMIVTAFAEGNRKQLRDLLSSDVYDGFVAAISEREAQGEVLEQQFVGIKKADILEAELKDGTASVTVRFVSDLISARRNKAGVVVDGDPNRIKEVTDIWTFTRDVSTKAARASLNWKLEGTQAPS